MRRHDHSKEHEAKVDLTPMIDMVFLLVMFFVLTSSFVSLNLEDVLLPVALQAAEQNKDAQGLLIINIKKENDQTRDGAVVFNGEKHSLEELTKALQFEAQYDADKRGRDAGGFSKLQVLVRADEGVQGKFLRQVFESCAKAKIWKVKLSALEKD